MQKILIILIAILVIVGGLFFISSNQEEQVVPEVETQVSETVVEEKDDAEEQVEMMDEEGESAVEPANEPPPTAPNPTTPSQPPETEPPATEPVEPVEEPEPQPVEEEGEEVVFNVSGVNFSFDVQEMRVNEGDTVTINFVSEEGFHDWVVDEFDAATDRVRSDDGVTSVTFVADAAGTYEYYCSVGSHRELGMVGALIVE